MASRLVGVELERYLAAVASALVRDLSPELVVLFGSFARGDQNRASDFDVVVITETELPLFSTLGEAGRRLDQLYIPTRYPNGLPSGVPHEFYDRGLAAQALAELDAVIACVERFSCLRSYRNPRQTPTRSLGLGETADLLGHSRLVGAPRQATCRRCRTPLRGIPPTLPGPCLT